MAQVVLQEIDIGLIVDALAAGAAEPVIDLSAKTEKLVAFLESKSIAVRFFGSDAGLENCIRVSVGRPAKNDAFLQAVDGYFGKDY